MKDEIKEIYLGSLEWTKTHDNIGGVMGNIVFKDNMSYEEYQKLFKNVYFVLCDKDYITNLQKSLEYANDEVVSYCNTTIDLQEENKRLHTRIKTIKRRRKAQTAKMRKYREEITKKQNSIEYYKSRNEKAIEYIENELIPFGNEWHWDEGGISYMVDDVLNILQGDDKDE